MKKMLLLMLAMVPFIFSSCGNDDDTLKSLSGTTWEYVEMDGSIEEFKGTIKFQSTTYTYEGHEFGDEFFGTGTYSYDDPTVIMTEKGESVTCTISGNKMTVNNESGFVYVKQ